MQKFDSNFLVFVSLILAAAVTEILSSIGSYIRNYKYIKFSYFIFGWSALTLLSMIQYWYALVVFNGKIENYTFDHYVIDIFSAICFYLLSRIILPDFSSCDVVDIIKLAKKEQSAKYDLDCYFYRNMLFMYGLAAILTIISEITDRYYWINNAPTSHESLFRIVFFVIICTGWTVSFLQRNHTDDQQKDYSKRKLAGAAYKVNMLMWIMFLILFLGFIVMSHYPL